LRIPEFFLGCLLTVAVFAIGILFSSEGGWLTKDAAGFFTFALVIVGALQAALFFFQLKLIRESLSPAKEAADAAKLNAQAVVDAERAYLFVTVEADVVPVMGKALAFAFASDVDNRSTFGFEISYVFQNHGRTPAIIREISHGACIAPEFPIERTYSHVIHLPSHLLASDKETPPIKADDVPKITTAIAKSIDDIEDTFWFYGNVTYDDMFGWRRTFDFVWHYSAVSEGFNLYSWTENQERRKSQNTGLSQPT
jgi:hypothetical protein